jgi:dTDP-4-amino-4,6-dideoxygalactose transaminase
LHLGLEALGVERGDRVLVPSMTFTASAEVVRYLGADPVFVDVDYGTRLVTPEIVERALQKDRGIKAAVIVHFGGQASQMLDLDGVEGILSVCRRYGVRTLEDAAHAFPARQRGIPVGSLGDVTCFSFYANKTITTGEGGMLTSEDDCIVRRVKEMRLHGINRDIWDRFTSHSSGWEYDVVAPGYKYNMPDINAAVGLAQLERAEEFREGRERCARYYTEHLSEIEELDLPARACPWEDHAWHLYPVVLQDTAPFTRDELINKLADVGIGTSVHYKPLHRMTYYRETYQLDPGDFPNTERIWRGTVSLPIYPGLSDEDLRYVCDTLRGVLKG